MTIVEGQIETLKQLKESLRDSGITRFNSIGQIRRFLKDYETEKSRLRSRAAEAVDMEIKGLQADLVEYKQACRKRKEEAHKEIEQRIKGLETDIRRAKEKGSRNILLRAICFFRIWSLSRRAARLKYGKEKEVEKKARAAEKNWKVLASKVENLVQDRESLIAKRYGNSLADLDHTKKVIDGLYALVAGAIGEASVVKTVQQLPDDYYLINDFSIEFDRPIYNRKEDDRIYSIQVDHLLVCKAGVFILETKNWSKASVEDLDLRSPVRQIQRTSFALFVLLNSDSSYDALDLERHHWGDKKIPIRNIIVMTNEKPQAEFKHVKVLPLKELNGYVQYFDQIFSEEEVESIFENLKRRMCD